MSEADFDEIMRDIRVYNMAFEMYLAGYGQRVEDEKKEPSSLRKKDDFRKHVRQAFEREWMDCDFTLSQ